MKVIEGMIILYYEGSLFKILQKDFPTKGTTLVQFVDENETRILDRIDLSCSTTFCSDEADLQFAIAHSIHKRLNKLKNV